MTRRTKRSPHDPAEDIWHPGAIHRGAPNSAIPEWTHSDGWHTNGAPDLEATIAEFKAKLPGWWFSICECQVSCDATCAPTRQSPHIALVEAAGDPFDIGFDVELEQPSSLAAALRFVMNEALQAIGARA